MLRQQEKIPSDFYSLLNRSKKTTKCQESTKQSLLQRNGHDISFVLLAIHAQISNRNI